MSRTVLQLQCLHQQSARHVIGAQETLASPDPPASFRSVSAAALSAADSRNRLEPRHIYLPEREQAANAQIPSLSGSDMFYVEK